jgi:hypothetical protein
MMCAAKLVRSWTELVALFAMSLAIVIVGCSRSSTPRAAAAASGGPIAPELPAPPPAHAVSLATATPADGAAAETELSGQVARLGKLSPEVEARLGEASFEGAAASSLVVLAGGRQADVARPPAPRHERWEIRFAPGTSVEAYARQLDFFKIELGVIGGQQQITYLTNLSNPKPTSRPGNAAEERRLYLIWQRGAISEVDEQIAARAGVKTGGAVIAHFLPKEVEDELARLEEARAKQLNIAKIGKTVFGIKSSQDRFQFSILDLKADQL